KIITTLKTGETDACPAVFDREAKEDFAIELLRALRLSHKNNQPFKHDFGDNVSISLSSLTLPDVKDSANIKKGGKLTDVEIMVDVQSLSDIHLNEYELQEERNYLSKNDKYLCFGKNDDKYALKIKTNEDCFDVLFEYIYGVTVKDPDHMITIRLNRIRNNQHRTVGELSVDNGTIRGYTLELPKGTDSECQNTCTDEKKAQNECKRILSGVYNFEINTTSSRADRNNTSLRLRDIPGRIGILIHNGVNARIWSMGCILAMRHNPVNDSDNATASQRANQDDDSLDFCTEIVEHVRRRVIEINQKYNVQNVEIIIITENNETND
ncbi:MAG: DUF5675 family protein, partial [Bacteroidales bacterium]|nr:DUF5675 family protein [Bacteroidales bacterium]